MFELKRLNVHRIVATEKERDKLLARGFVLVKPKEQKAKTKAGK